LLALLGAHHILHVSRIRVNVHIHRHMYTNIYIYNIYYCFLCFVDRASRYNRVKKNQLDAQPILSIFRQPLHVSSVCRTIIRRYNRMYTTTGTYFSFRRLSVALDGLELNCRFW